MAEFNQLVITNKGQTLISKIMAGLSDVSFTKIVTSDKDYSESDLTSLETLENIKQESLVSKVERTEEDTVNVEGSVTNIELSEGYFVRTIGLYAMDPDDGEILYAVTTANVEGYIPAFNNSTVSGANFKLATKVSNSENVSIEVDPSAVATIGNLADLEEKINELKIKVGNVSNFTAEPSDGVVTLKLSDPQDLILDGVVLSQWVSTMIRRSTVGYPVDENDGDLVVVYDVRNQYKTTGFDDVGLNNETKYYYSAFPRAKNGAYTISDFNRVESTPVAYTMDWSENVTDLVTSVSDGTVSINYTKPIDATGVLIRRSLTASPSDINSGDLVYDGANESYDDTGLTNETEYFYSIWSYNASKQYSQTAVTFSATPTLSDDTSGSPGPSTIINGSTDEGFYGIVPSSDFVTGDALASDIGLTSGTSQNSTEDWIKYSWKDKVCFVPKKTFRYNLSWDNINAIGAVDGTKTTTVNGLTFKVRLMRGALTDPPAYSDPDKGAKGSEWNRIILPLHEHAATGNWAYPNNVEVDLPDWGIGFTDQDLLTHNDFGKGSRSWCQESPSVTPASRVSRGTNGASFSIHSTSSYPSTALGWRPVLELV